MKVEELLKLEDFKPVNIADGLREIKGVYIGDLLSWVMKSLQADEAWLTIMSNVNILAVSALSDAAVIILCDGVDLDEEVCKTAVDKEINVVSTNLSAYEVAVILSKNI